MLIKKKIQNYCLNGNIFELLLTEVEKECPRQATKRQRQNRPEQADNITPKKKMQKKLSG